MRPLTLSQLRGALHNLAQNAKPQAPTLELLKIAAILAAGLWTAWIYFAHQRQFQSLLNEHQRLANQQLQFTIRQAQASAEYDIAHARLAAETAALQNQLARLEIRDRTANGVFVQHELDIEQANRAANAYSGSFEITVENKSKSPVEISWAAFELYIGYVPHLRPADAVIFVNGPPNQELKIPGQHGPVVWKHLVTYGYYYPNSERLDYSKFTPYDYYQKGGPLMKTLAAGESTTFRMPLVITAANDRWVAVVSTFGMDGELGGEKVFNTADWIDLRSATKP